MFTATRVARVRARMVGPTVTVTRAGDVSNPRTNIVTRVTDCLNIAVVKEVIEVIRRKYR